MSEYSFTATEHNPDKPWLVIGPGRHTIELDAEVNFFDWAREHWPEAHWTVQLDPWQLEPGFANR